MDAQRGPIKLLGELAGRSLRECALLISTGLGFFKRFRRPHLSGLPVVVAFKVRALSLSSSPPQCHHPCLLTCRISASCCRAGKFVSCDTRVKPRIMSPRQQLRNEYVLFWTGRRRFRYSLLSPSRRTEHPVFRRTHDTRVYGRRQGGSLKNCDFDGTRCESGPAVEKSTLSAHQKSPIRAESLSNGSCRSRPALRSSKLSTHRMGPPASADVTRTSLP